MAGPILEFRDISYRVSGRSILRRVSLAVEEGETVALLGRSGSGKTTLLRMALRLVEPGEGEVRFDGKPVRAWDPIRLRRRMGYVIQEVGLFPHFTVERNVGLVPRLEGWPAERVRARVEELLERVGLPAAEFAVRRPRDLSGGQRQRVGVARALAADPPVLLLDEPFGALDPVTRLELQRQFLALNQSLRKTAVFVTHDVREALLVGTRIVLLKQGEVEFAGSREQFLAADTPEARAFRAVLEWEKRDWGAQR
jgi:osmoprotectant transport system ATP-binding protein